MSRSLPDRAPAADRKGIFTMDLSQLLRPEAVRVVSDVTSKKRLLQKIADIAEGQIGLPAPRIFDALQERESLGPTGVGHGVALPHARLDTVSNVHGAFLKLERPIDFESADKQPVDLVFALFAPSDTGVDHLKALALVSRTLRNPALCTKLRANSDAATLHTLLTEAEASQAA